MRIFVPKLQNLILRVTRRDAEMEHYIVANVAVSPQNHKMIWITTLLGSRAPQKLVSYSSVKFDIKSFQLDVNIDTLSTESRSDHEQEL